MHRKQVATLLLAAAPLCACSGDSPARETSGAMGDQVWFEDVTAESGLSFEHVAYDEQSFRMPECVGAGIALIDYDGDGDLDVYCLQSGDPAATGGTTSTNRLFRNDGSGRFEDVTEGSGAGDQGNGRGAAVGDYDQDGDLDLYVTNLGPNALLQNNGDGTFSDVTIDAGVGHPGWGASAAFFDADRDGDLDLFIANYVDWSLGAELPCTGAGGGLDYCNPTNFDAPAQDVLFMNEGDGTFSDRSEAAGLSSAFGNGFGVVVDDFDGDGWQDVYVANDGTANQLWINGQDGTFKDRSLLSGCAVNMNGAVEAGMGVAVLDLENDGDPDLLMTHLRSESNTLYVNRRGVFRDRTLNAGLHAASLQFTGFGLGIADFNQDGNLDLYVGNGRVQRWTMSFDPEKPYAEPNQLFRGLGGAKFEEVKPQGGVQEAYIGSTRGLALGDIDGDGDIDIVLSENGDRARVLRNVAADGNWISFRVVTPEGQPLQDVVGARVRVDFGDEVRWRTITGAYGFCSANQIHAHVGLGDAAAIDGVTVHWPDGGEPEAFGPFTAGATHVLVRGQGDGQVPGAQK
ncbi:MAG: CRTAC1 family protein [Planctomycetota bacterium]|nr:CRTAC1 family protein [Planctomycetota bacterium]